MKHVIMGILLLFTLTGCGVDWFPLNVPEITTASLPAAAIGVSYNQTLSASGGTPPLTWAVLNGSLPPGLSLSTGGVISGTPTEAGSFTFTVIAVDPATKLDSTHTYAIVVIAATALPATTAGTNYSYQFQAPGGGTPPFTWKLATGSLPPGLTLSSTGLISGSATTAGDYLFSVTVSDSSNPPNSLTHFYSIHVNAASGGGTTTTTLSITTTSLPAATVNTVYRQKVSASGGTTPYNWSITSGNLPAGLTFRTISSAGVIAGTPTAAASPSLTFKVTDSSTTVQTANTTLTLTVSP
ncbi:MAG TPA: putative Ig domain-containing protein [Geomonas sp.]|nr:putative Ig domain-containing protein [Geomonas sp.]